RDANRDASSHTRQVPDVVVGQHTGVDAYAGDVAGPRIGPAPGPLARSDAQRAGRRPRVGVADRAGQLAVDVQPHLVRHRVVDADQVRPAAYDGCRCGI